jgi:hypothetical protein
LRRSGRLDAAPLAGVAEWVEYYRRFWDDSFDTWSSTFGTFKDSDMTDPPTQELTITRIFDAPRELVFQAWIDPDPTLHPRYATGEVSLADLAEEYSVGRSTIHRVIHRNPS